MAFEKIHSKRGHRKLDVPALSVGKSMCTLNKAFCDKIGLDTTGDLASMDLFYDVDTKKFGIKLYKSPDKGDKLVKYNKSHQAQVYLRAMFKQHGYAVKESFLIKVKRDKKLKMWIFKIPTKHLITDEEKAVKVLKRKKKKKEKRNKRDKNEIGRKI